MVISVANLLGEAIQRIHGEQSVSELFSAPRVMQPANEGQ